jgi:hypothetical protein
MDGERSMKRGGWREVDGEKWMEKEKKWMMEGCYECSTDREYKVNSTLQTN